MSILETLFGYCTAQQSSALGGYIYLVQMLVNKPVSKHSPRFFFFFLFPRHEMRRMNMPGKRYADPVSTVTHTHIVIVIIAIVIRTHANPYTHERQARGVGLCVRVIKCTFFSPFFVPKPTIHKKKKEKRNKKGGSRRRKVEGRMDGWVCIAHERTLPFVVPWTQCVGNKTKNIDHIPSTQQSVVHVRMR